MYQFYIESSLFSNDSSRPLAVLFIFEWESLQFLSLNNCSSFSIQMPRTRRRHRSRSGSRTGSRSAVSPQYEHKRRRIDNYDSPHSKGTYRWVVLYVAQFFFSSLNDSIIYSFICWLMVSKWNGLTSIGSHHWYNSYYRETLIRGSIYQSCSKFQLVCSRRSQRYLRLYEAVYDSGLFQVCYAADWFDFKLTQSTLQLIVRILLLYHCFIMCSNILIICCDVRCENFRVVHV